MKDLIRKLLREQMIPFTINWRENLMDYGKSLSTLISKDNETNNKLYLFVGFNDIDGLVNYSYSFILVDAEGSALTDYMVKRSEVNKYLPNEIKNKKIIIPIIMDMTRELLDKNLPPIIVRETAESLSGDSLKRYEEITNLMVNEYGYTIIETTKNEFGGTKWVLSKTESKDNNKELDETYNIQHNYTAHEIAQKVFGGLDLKKLKG